MEMKASIDWGGGEPKTTCLCEKRGHGSTSQALRSGQTPYMLRFEGRWFRIYTEKLPGGGKGYYVNIGGRHTVTLEPVDSEALKTRWRDRSEDARSILERLTQTLTTSQIMELRAEAARLVQQINEPR